jgi:hypothetical protein
VGDFEDSCRQSLGVEAWMSLYTANDVVAASDTPQNHLTGDYDGVQEYWIFSSL